MKGRGSSQTGETRERGREGETKRGGQREGWGKERWREEEIQWEEEK